MFFNSFVIAIAVTLTNVVLGSSRATPFARLRFPGRNVLFLIVLATLMIPDQLGCSRSTSCQRTRPEKGLLQLASVILVLAISATSVFLLRQYFLTIPKDLEEAARIDGAGHFTTFLRVMLPLASPAIAAVTILQFQGTWNGFFWPFVLIRDRPVDTAARPHAVPAQWRHVERLAAADGNRRDRHVPILILYMFFQRYFVEGSRPPASRARAAAHGVEARTDVHRPGDPACRHRLLLQLTAVRPGERRLGARRPGGPVRGDHLAAGDRACCAGCGPDRGHASNGRPLDARRAGEHLRLPRRHASVRAPGHGDPGRRGDSRRVLVTNVVTGFGRARPSAGSWARRRCGAWSRWRWPSSRSGPCSSTRAARAGRSAEGSSSPGLVVIGRPGRLFLLTVLIVAILVASTLLLGVIILVGVAYTSLLATRWVLPAVDDLESRYEAARAR
jgi:multiple sugar transport system permease protein